MSARPVIRPLAVVVGFGASLLTAGCVPPPPPGGLAYYDYPDYGVEFALRPYLWSHRRCWVRHCMDPALVQVPDPSGRDHRRAAGEVPSGPGLPVAVARASVAQGHARCPRHALVVGGSTAVRRVVGAGSAAAGRDADRR